MIMLYLVMASFHHHNARMSIEEGSFQTLSLHICFFPHSRIDEDSIVDNEMKLESD